jgi:ribonuclease HI
MIIARASLSGNGTCKASNNSIRDFSILKLFKVNTYHPIAPVIKEVIWNPSLVNWIKCNIDGASRGNPGLSFCAGVFRNHAADVLCCYAEPLGIASSFYAKLCGAMRVVELAHQRNYTNLWIETDLALVVLAFKNIDKHKVIWSLRNKWKNVQVMLKQLNYIVSHTFREGNEVADMLANHELSLNAFCFWHNTLSFLRPFCVKNKLSMPSFRFFT